MSQISDEFRKKLKAFYENILNRIPDEDSLKYFFDLKNLQNLSFDDIEKIIKNSLEAKSQKTKQFLKYAPKFATKYGENEIKEMINANPSWYHTFEFGNVRTKNTRTSLEYQMWAAQDIPMDLSGKTVLDIGAADGFYSFLCEKRGAERVLALDFMLWEGFPIIKKILNSKVEHKIMNVNDLDNLGEIFDLVLFYGVYYHLENPVTALRKIFSKVNETVFLTGHIINHDQPLMCYYDEYEMHPQDASNWWAATPACLENIGRRIGFKRSEMIGNLVQNIDFQPEHVKNSIRRLGNIGLFIFSKNSSTDESNKS